MTESFKWDGADYQQFSRYQTEQGRELVKLLGAATSGKILDVGCGNGLLTLEIGNKNPDGFVIGIDSSEDMLRKAEENKKLHGIANVAFQTKSALSIDYKNELDAIFSNSALHWVNDHKELLKKFYTALKPGGRIVSGFASKGNVGLFLEALRDVMLDEEFSPYFMDFNFSWYFPGEEYMDLIESTSFKVNNLEFITVEMRMTEDELRGWFRTVGMPYYGYLPEMYSLKFFDKVIGKYIESMQGKGIILTFKRIVVEAARE